MITTWYKVSRIMGQIIPPTFPWFTFEGIVDEIMKDPEFKKEDGSN
jgi:hypothetical protein